jgi:hypothetical protein
MGYQQEIMGGPLSTQHRVHPPSPDGGSLQRLMDDMIEELSMDIENLMPPSVYSNFNDLGL